MLKASLALAFALVLSPGAQAADPPIDLKWAQLMPPLEAKPKPKTFFSGAAPTTMAGHDGGPPPPSTFQEGKFMSIKRR